jgi:hypothetical protein
MTARRPLVSAGGFQRQLSEPALAIGDATLDASACTAARTATMPDRDVMLGGESLPVYTATPALLRVALLSSGAIEVGLEAGGELTVQVM